MGSVLIVIALAGCQLSIQYGLALSPDTVQRPRKLEYLPCNSDVKMAVECDAQDSEVWWNLTLTVCIKNEQVHPIVFDRRDATLTFGDPVVFSDGPDGVTHGYRDADLLVRIPPGKEATLYMDWAGDENMWEFYRCSYLQFTLGELRTEADSLLCDLPTVYAFPLNRSQWW